LNLLKSLQLNDEIKMDKFDSIISAVKFVHDNKEELMKNLSSYEHILSVLKKAVDGEDAAEKWLREKAAGEKPSNDKVATNQEEPKKKTYSKDWEARSDYSPKEAAAVKKFTEDGYSPREAERMAGAHKGPRNYEAALKSGINPSMPSDKMMGHLKGMAKEWLETARNRELANANEDVNPLKHASGQMKQAHEANTKDFHQAHSDFLSSDSVKNLSPRDRFKAVQDWKGKWKQDNPDYEEGQENISNAQSKFADAAQNIKQKSEDVKEHIARAGVGEAPDMSDQEAMQHLGGGKTDEGYEGGSITKNPTAAFAAKNPRYVKLLNDEQNARVDRINSAHAAQGKVRQPISAPSPEVKVRKKPQEPQG
jgi:hypothetical protein